jgi:hypothetical protein
LSSLKFKTFVPVILEGELESVVVYVVTIGEIDAPAKLKFTTDGDSLQRVIEQIA